MLAVLALIVGAVSGLVGALFLLLLEQADRFRDAVIVWAHSKAFAGFLVVSIACTAGEEALKNSGRSRPKQPTTRAINWARQSDLAPHA